MRVLGLTFSVVFTRLGRHHQAVSQRRPPGVSSSLLSAAKRDCARALSQQQRSGASLKDGEQHCELRSEWSASPAGGRALAVIAKVAATANAEPMPQLRARPATFLSNRHDRRQVYPA